MVHRAAELDYPALGLTDHGSVAGNVQLYTACRKEGIEPLPGIELYVVPDIEYAGRKDNLHLTMNAYTEAGYRNLMKVATLTSKHFWYKPIIDFADFAQMAEEGVTQGLAVSTGCFFGVLPQVLMHQGPTAALQVVRALAGWFPRVYVELQNHGIDEHGKNDKGIDITDDELNEEVFAIAEEAGLPCVITRDSHYIEEKDKPLHESLKQLVSFSEDPDEAIFPGGGYFMTDEAGMRRYLEPKYVKAGLEGLSDLASAAHVRLPELEHFTLKVPDVTPGQDPWEVLDKLVNTAYITSDVWGEQAYSDAIDTEMAVLKGNGMAAYIVLVDQVCTFMRQRKISYHARGSAAGSVINWLLKITQVDPIVFGLRYDRFMSSNRMKPPDVDLDVEHKRRDEVVAFISGKWSVRSVGSHRKYSLYEEDDDEGHGSLKVKYYSTLRKSGREKMPTWDQVPKADKAQLQALADMKLVAGYGTHAAGYIVAPDEESVENLPLAWIASSKKMVTAYGKKDVEKMGYVKLDLLGLRTRTAIRVMSEESGVDFDTMIPDGDKATYDAIGKGKTTGVFQLDGFSMRNGCQQLKPRNINDLMAAQALFRPATMNSGATEDYIERRRKASPVPQRHSDIMTATSETYGVLLYQEQVMDVMEVLGMTPAELEEMLDAVKASNEYSEGAATVIAEKMPQIRRLAEGRGWSGVDIEWLVEALVSYADYSFNKAHAASYAVVAYRTAYMRVHHPIEFWLGMLVAYADATKQKGRVHKTVTYTTEARAYDGVKIFGPHVNKSKATYTYDRKHGGIRKGLLTVRGVADVASRELEAKAPYSSLTDMGRRLLPRRVSGSGALALRKSPPDCGGIIEALDNAGALEGLEHEPYGPDSNSADPAKPGRRSARPTA